ncbi:MAG: hypothetical protein HQL17_06055 [Candidatus Omnitrophica bacterium]|nr:hypothetical protein [Candidatus Omnitrophota bacterium]
MNHYLFFTILAFAIIATGVFSGMTKGMKQGFDNDLAENSYHSAPMIESQSDKTSRLQERNEHLMDDVRAKMDRLKRN